MSQEIKQVNVWTSLFYGIRIPAKEDLPADVLEHLQHLYDIGYCEARDFLDSEQKDFLENNEISEFAVQAVLKDVLGTPHADIISDDDYVRCTDRGGDRKILGYVAGVRLTELWRDVFDKDITAMIEVGQFVSDNQTVDLDPTIGRLWEQRAEEIGIKAKCQLHLV